MKNIIKYHSLVIVLFNDVFITIKSTQFYKRCLLLSQRVFPKLHLPKCTIFQAATKVCPSRSARPPAFSSPPQPQRLAPPIAACGASEALTSHYRTTGIEDCTKQHDYRTSRLLYIRTMQYFKTTRLQDQMTKGLHYYRNTGLQEHMTTGQQDFRTSRLQDYSTTIIQDYRTTGLRDYKTTG